MSIYLIWARAPTLPAQEPAMMLSFFGVVNQGLTVIGESIETSRCPVNTVHATKPKAPENSSPGARPGIATGW